MDAEGYIYTREGYTNYTKESNHGWIFIIIVVVFIIIVGAIVGFVIFYKKPVPPPSNIPLSLLTFNPHYQCFAAGNECCSNVIVNYINTNLISRNIDFANIIEMEIYNYQPPTGFSIINKQCGSISSGDYISMIYNNVRWTPVGAPNTYCIGNRPTIIQQYRLINQNTLVWVIGAHFTHDLQQYVSGLNTAITQMGISVNDKVVFMADTNQVGTSEKLITDILGFRPPIIMASTQDVGTCCYPHFSQPYDRIITTFGSAIQSYIPTFNEIVPNPTSNCSYSEFHKAIFAVIH